MHIPIQTLELSETRRLKIYQDEQPDSPREWDNLGTMVCWHKRYNLGDKQVETNSDYDELMQLLNRKDVISLPLYLYDHSGLTMNVKGFASHWDSGQVGYIYVEHSKVREQMRVMRVSKHTRAYAKSILRGEVETYDQWLRGDIYGFVIEDLSTCDKGHTHEEVLDSVWGFYGSDIKENGMLDHFDKETRDLVLKVLDK